MHGDASGVEYWEIGLAIPIKLMGYMCERLRGIERWGIWGSALSTEIAASICKRLRVAPGCERFRILGEWVGNPNKAQGIAAEQFL